MEVPPLKILVAGDVNGKFASFFSRIEAVNSKNGPFDMLFVAGSFFSVEPDQDDPDWMSYLSGDKTVPVPTYILGPVKDHQLQHYSNAPGGGEICPNVHYLGAYGLFRTAEGLTIGYLSGTYSAPAFGSISGTATDLRAHYCRGDVGKLCDMGKADGFKGVDVLLTSEWPLGVAMLAPIPPAKEKGATRDAKSAENMGIDHIAAVARTLRPRYHFSGLEGVFYERPPYRNSAVLTREKSHVTRFIAIADQGNAAKHKALYAFNMTPMSKTPANVLSQEPPGTTENPLAVAKQQAGNGGGPMGGVGSAPDENFSYFYGQQSGGQKRRHDGPRGPPPSGYVCKICNTEGHWIQDCPQRSDNKRPRGDRPPPQTSQECWFCLSGANVEKHMVVSVGNEFYIALAKGPLVPEHVLILPIMHVPSSLELTDDAREELDKYKDALVRYFESMGMSCVFFERNFASRHMQMQVVPVPASMDINQLKASFKEHGANGGFGFQDFPPGTELKDVTDSAQQGFFLAEFPDKARLVYIKEKDARFPLQFGREVLGSRSALNCPERIDWKACKQTKDEETEAAQSMRKAFKKFDIM